MELPELYKGLIARLLHRVNGPWDRIEVEFEYFPWNGDYMEVHKARYYDDGVRHEFTIGIDGNDAFIAINGKMADNGQEPWTSCRFTLDSTGKYDLDFGYGMPPLIENLLRTAGEIA